MNEFTPIIVRMTDDEFLETFAISRGGLIPTTIAAKLIGVSRPGIRKAIEEGRLTVVTAVNHKWLAVDEVRTARARVKSGLPPFPRV